MSINIKLRIPITLIHGKVVLKIMHLLAQIAFLNQCVTPRLQVELLVYIWLVELLDHHEVSNMLWTNTSARFLNQHGLLLTIFSGSLQYKLRFPTLKIVAVRQLI